MTLPTSRDHGAEPFNGEIPVPWLQSHMHQRVKIPKPTQSQRAARDAAMPRSVQIAQALITRLIRRLGFLRPTRKWAFHRVIMVFLRLYYKVFHGLLVYGEENIPPEGAIFCVNHPNAIDVVISFMAAFRRPLGIFTDMGDSFMTDMAELIGIVPRVGLAPIMVEKMIRQIALRNRYFVMWPEGTPDKGYGVMQGFSGIARAYAILNAQKDRIPFVPVVMQTLNRTGNMVEGQFKSFEKLKAAKDAWRAKKASKAAPSTVKKGTVSQTEQRKFRKFRRKWRLHFHETVRRVIFTYLKPVYIPRPWLLPPEEGGKSQREIIDFVMLKIARTLGQPELRTNPSLDWRKTNSSQPWHG